MKLLFKQRFFSWFDSYDIYNEDGEAVYTVEGKLAWGHKLAVMDQSGSEIGLVQQALFTLMPRFVISIDGREVGEVRKEFTLLRPAYQLDCLGWQVDGDFLGWDYTITAPDGSLVATISKELFRWTDTYVLDIVNPLDSLYVLMVALAIDAANCSGGD